MDKAKFYEHQYVSIREEIKETKARIFKLAWLGLIGVPTAYLFAEKYEILVVTLTMPVIICTLMLLFIAESMALMRAGRYIRLCIEPIIIEFVPKAEKKESNDVVEEEEPSDEVDATGATDCFLEVGWETWLEGPRQKGEPGRRLVDKLVTIFFYSLFTFYYIAAGWLAVVAAEKSLGIIGLYLALVFYVAIAVVSAKFFYWYYKEGTRTSVNC